MTIFYLSRGDHPVDLAAGNVSQSQTFSTEGLGDEELLFGEFLNEAEPKLVAVLVDSTGVTGGQVLLLVDNEVYADITGIKDFFLILAANIAVLFQSISTWNISTLTQIQDFNGVLPQDVFFSPDGTRMYFAVSSGFVVEYALSIPWDISVATQIRTEDFSDDLAALSSSGPYGVSFKYDGRKMYLAGHSNGVILEYNLSTPWNITTASFVQSIGSSDSSPHTVAWKPDGTKMYTCGQSPSRIFEWDLTTPWDISTAMIVNTENLGLFVPQGIAWKPDGTKMYVAALNAPNGTRIREFNLSTPWNISTAVLNQSFTLSTSFSGATGIYIRVDGVKVYVSNPIGSSAVDVREYEMAISTPHAGDALVMVVQGEQV